MRRIRGVLLLTAGVAMILTGALMLAAHERQAAVAGKNAEVLLGELSAAIRRSREEAIYDTAVEEPVPAGQMIRTTLQGYALVGILRVPILDMELPVLENWSYDLLQIAPCRYSGSVEEGNLILLGHNYKKHFTPLKKLKPGAEVEFCDVQGTVYRYLVVETEILQPAELDRLTGSDHDLTLFTCTTGGYSRFVVRCERIAEDGQPL